MIPNPKGGRRFASASSEAAPKNSDAREKIYCNAQMSSRPIRTFRELSTDCERFLEHASLSKD